MKIRGVWVVAVLLATMVSTVARADNKAAAREHYQAASKAYDVGDYDEAIREFTTAYKLHDDPTLLYNLAQAHRLAGHNVEALRAFRNYLIKLPNAPNRAEVEKHIGELAAGTPTPAHDTAADAAQQAYARGQAHLDAHETDAAVSELEKAHALKSTPPIELALGRAYEQASRRDDALTAYRRYVAFTPAPNDAADVRTHIAVLEQPAPTLNAGADLAVTQTPPPAKKRKAWVIPVAVVGAVVVVGLSVGLGVGLTLSKSNPHAANMVTVP